jgi:hypothetical protein
MELSREHDTEDYLCCPNGHRGKYSSTTAAIAKKNVRPAECYEPMICGKCAMTFWVLKEFKKLRKEDGEGWWCPGGHCRVYTKPEEPKTEAQVDYGKMIQYHDALARIATIKPKFGRRKKDLKLIINIARSVLALAEMKEE